MPKRKGKPVCLTIEFSALEQLHALCPNGKAYGKFLSDLIWQEAARRQALTQVRERLSAVEEVLTAP
jgi:hypothetical protein